MLAPGSSSRSSNDPTGPDSPTRRCSPQARPRPGRVERLGPFPAVVPGPAHDPHPKGRETRGEADSQDEAPLFPQGQRTARRCGPCTWAAIPARRTVQDLDSVVVHLSLIHISEPTRLGMISYAV